MIYYLEVGLRVFGLKWKIELIDFDLIKIIIFQFNWCGLVTDFESNFSPVKLISIKQLAEILILHHFKRGINI